MNHILVYDKLLVLALLRHLSLVIARIAIEFLLKLHASESIDRLVPITQLIATPSACGPTCDSSGQLRSIGPNRSETSANTLHQAHAILFPETVAALEHLFAARRQRPRVLRSLAINS